MSINEIDVSYILGGGGTKDGKQWLFSVLGRSDYELSKVLDLINAYSRDEASPPINTVKIMQSISKICHGLDGKSANLMPTASISEKTLTQASVEIITFLSNLIDRGGKSSDKDKQAILENIAVIVESTTAIQILPEKNTSALLDAVILGVSSLCDKLMIGELVKVQAASRLIMAETTVMKYLKAYIQSPKVSVNLSTRDKHIITNIINFLSGLHNTELGLLQECRDQISNIVNKKSVQDAIDKMIGIPTIEMQEQTQAVLQTMISLTAIDEIIDKVMKIDKSLGESLISFRKDNPDITDTLISMVDSIVREVSPKMPDDDRREIEIILSVLMGNTIFPIVGGGHNISILDKITTSLLIDQHEKPKRGRVAIRIRRYVILYNNIIDCLREILKFISKNDEVLADHNMEKLILDLSRQLRVYSYPNISLALAEIDEKKQVTMNEKIAIMHYMNDLCSLKKILSELQVKTSVDMKKFINKTDNAINEMLNAISALIKRSSQNDPTLDEYVHMVIDRPDNHTAIIQRSKLVGGLHIELPIGKPIKIESKFLDSLPKIASALNISMDNGGISGGRTIHSKLNENSTLKVGDILVLLDRYIKPDKVKKAKNIEKKKENDNAKKTIKKTIKKAQKKSKLKGGSHDINNMYGLDNISSMADNLIGSNNNPMSVFPQTEKIDKNIESGSESEDDEESADEEINEDSKKVDPEDYIIDLDGGDSSYITKTITASNIASGLESIIKSSSITRTLGYKSSLSEITDKENLETTIKASRELFKQYEEAIAIIIPEIDENYKECLEKIVKLTRNGIYSINIFNKYISAHRQMIEEILTKKNQTPIDITYVGTISDTGDVIEKCGREIMTAAARPMKIENNNLVSTVKDGKISNSNDFMDKLKATGYDINTAHEMFPPTFNTIPNSEDCQNILNNKNFNPFKIIFATIHTQLMTITRDTGVNTDELKKMIVEIMNGFVDLYKAVIFTPAKVISTITVTGNEIIPMEMTTVDYNSTAKALSRLFKTVPDNLVMAPTYPMANSIFGYPGGTLKEIPSAAKNVNFYTRNPTSVAEKEITDKYVLTWINSKMTHVREAGILQIQKDLFKLLNHSICAIYSTILSDNVKSILSKMTVDLTEDKIYSISSALMLVGGDSTKVLKISKNLEFEDIISDTPDGKNKIKSEIFEAVFDLDGDFVKEIETKTPDKWCKTLQNVSLIMNYVRIQRLVAHKKELKANGGKVMPKNKKKNMKVKGGNVYTRMSRYVDDIKDRIEPSITQKMQIDENTFGTTFKMTFIVNDIMKLLIIIQDGINKDNPNSSSVILAEPATSTYSNLVKLLRIQMTHQIRKMQIDTTKKIGDFEPETYAELFFMLQDMVKGKSYNEITIMLMDIYKVIYTSIAVASVPKEDLLKLASDESDDYLTTVNNPYDQISDVNAIATTISSEYNMYNPDVKQKMGAYGSTSADLEKAIENINKNAGYDKKLIDIIKSIIEHYKKKITASITNNENLTKQLIDETLTAVKNMPENPIQAVYIKFKKNTSDNVGVNASFTDIFLMMISESLVFQYKSIKEIIMIIMSNSRSIMINLVAELIRKRRDDALYAFNRITLNDAWNTLSRSYKVYELLTANEFISSFEKFNPYSSDIYPTHRTTAIMINNNADVITYLMGGADTLYTEIKKDNKYSKDDVSIAEFIVDAVFPVHSMAFNMMMGLTMGSVEYNSDISMSFGIRFDHDSSHKVRFETMPNIISIMLIWFNKECEKIKDKNTLKMLNQNKNKLDEVKRICTILEGRGKGAALTPKKFLHDTVSYAYGIWTHKMKYLQCTINAPLQEIPLDNNVSLLIKISKALFPFMPDSNPNVTSILLGESINFSDPISPVIRYDPSNDTKSNIYKFSTHTISRLAIYSLSQLDEFSGVISSKYITSTMSGLSQVIASIINCGINGEISIILDWISDISEIVNKYSKGGLYPDFLATLLDIRAIQPGIMSQEGDKISPVLNSQIAPITDPILNRMPGQARAGDSITDHMKVLPINYPLIPYQTIMGMPNGEVVILESLYSTIQSIESITQKGLADTRIGKVSLITSTSSINLEWRERISAACHTLKPLLENIICQLRNLCHVIKHIPVDMLDSEIWISKIVVLQPCVKVFNTKALSELKDPQSMTKSDIKSLLLRNSSIQLSLAKDLLQLVDRHIDDLKVIDYLGNTNYDLDSIKKPKQHMSIDGLSIMMKSLHTPDIDAHNDINAKRITMRLPEGGIIIGTAPISTSMVKQDDLSAIKINATEMGDMVSVIAEKRKLYTQALQVLISTINILRNLVHTIANAMPYYTGNVAIAIPYVYNNVHIVSTQGVYEYMFLSSPMKFPNLPVNIMAPITTVGHTMSDLIELLRHMSNELSNGYMIPGTNNIQYRLKVSIIPNDYIWIAIQIPDNVILTVQKAFTAAHAMRSLSNDIAELKYTVGSTSRQTYMQILTMAGLNSNNLMIVSNVYEYYRVNYVNGGSFIEDSIKNNIGAFAGHGYSSVNRFVMSYMAPVVSFMSSKKEGPAIYNAVQAIFNKNITGIKQKSPLEMAAKHILKTLYYAFVSNTRKLYFPVNNPALDGISMKSRFNINRTTATNAVKLMYTDVNAQSIIDMNATGEYYKPADKIVAQEITERGLMTVFSVRTAMTMISTNIGIISSSVIFQEYLKSWFSTTDNDSKKVCDFIKILFEEGSISYAEMFSVIIPVICGTEKYLPEPLMGIKKIFTQMLPSLFTIRQTYDLNVANMSFDPSILNEAYYTFGENYSFENVNILQAGAKNIRELLLSYKCSAFDSNAIKILVLIESLNSIIYKIYAGASVQQNDQDFMKLNIR